MDPLADDFADWNPYHYVHNNPMIMTDPTGMSADTINPPSRNRGNSITQIPRGFAYAFDQFSLETTGNDMATNFDNTGKKIGNIVSWLFGQGSATGNGGSGSEQKGGIEQFGENTIHLNEGVDDPGATDGSSGIMIGAPLTPGFSNFDSNKTASMAKSFTQFEKLIGKTSSTSNPFPPNVAARKMGVDTITLKNGRKVEVDLKANIGGGTVTNSRYIDE